MKIAQVGCSRTLSHRSDGETMTLLSSQDLIGEL
jgi:hypothetical protein